MLGGFAPDGGRVQSAAAIVVGICPAKQRLKRKESDRWMWHMHLPSQFSTDIQKA